MRHAQPQKLPASPGVSTLAANIRALRKARGWSQTDLAERIGAHLTHVSRVETGKYLPALDFVIKMARAFGVTVDALVSAPEGALEQVRIEDKNLAERMRLMDGLDVEERQALIVVIDSMLTKQRIRRFLEEKPVQIAN